MRILIYILFTVCSSSLFAQQTTVSNKTSTGKYVLVIHGGAGTLNKSQFTPALEAKYKSGLDSALLVGNAILEKGGVNFSAVEGPLHPKMVTSLNVTEEVDFFATGVSIVMHPENPWVPIIHMNVRYFELSNGEFWFGGGIDLTPHIIIPEQAKWFHEQLKAVCDRFDPSYYPKYKNCADDYFYSPHREETRGIGGIFFDYIKGDKETVFEFVNTSCSIHELCNTSKERVRFVRDIQFK